MHVVTDLMAALSFLRKYPADNHPWRGKKKKKRGEEAVINLTEYLLSILEIHDTPSRMKS